ncbi:DUF7379 domain-containing protein [Variovorax sp. JS1663]|uniref:DUF7379 domain-containing protein n=1 Tax=Variovorax sp. JS1663 TaxID=1851577 RepID=UPI000B34641C|nr:TCAD7 domain-containing protein [Variovorax sp. JS1663]OUL97992.1 hypothetical protein A8M77_33890 [Variovorax sp. JS1663]
MDITHPADAGITLTFDEGVWEADPAPTTRVAPFIGGMGGTPIASAPTAGLPANPDFDWLVGQLSSEWGVSKRELPELVRRPGASTRALDLTTTPMVTVDLAADESATLLVECEGVVAWQFADAIETPNPSAVGTTRASMAPARRARFVVQAPGAATATAQQQRNVFADWMLERVKVVVLKYIATQAASVIVNQLEKKKRIGPVIVAADKEAVDWDKPENFAEVSLPNANARVLLLVHGTFSSTAGAFGDLRATRWGQALLKEADAKYDALIGYDHRTLSVEPSENASGLYEALKTLNSPQPPTIDIVCHSRGALVTRFLIEKILPRAPWQPHIGKVIFVGSTNAGTELARPENWHALLDLLTNLALAGRKALTLLGAPQAGFAAGELVEGIGDFVRYLVDAAVEHKRAPGLAAMDPGGAFVLDINQLETDAPRPKGAQYYSIVSSFRPILVDAERSEPKEFPRRLALMLANGFIGALMKNAGNDLVVNVGSMSSIDPVAGNYIKDTQDFGTNPLVYHTNYFVQPETVDAIADWLDLAPVRAVKAVNAELMDPRIVVVESSTLVKEALQKASDEGAHFVVFRRSDPDYPGTLHYTPNLDELRRAHPDASMGEALHVRESRCSRVVPNGPFLRSLEGRTPLEADEFLPEYSRRAVVVEGDRPVAVIPTDDAALDVLTHATEPPVRFTRGVTRSFEGTFPTSPLVEGSTPIPPVTSPTEPVVCNINAEMPPTVMVGSRATVTVTLSADEITITPGALAQSTAVKLQKRPITIEVVPRVGFHLASALIEDSRATLPEPPTSGNPCVLDVDVIATNEGSGEIWVIVRQGAVRSVTLSLRPQILGSSTTIAAPPLAAQGTIQNGDDLPDVATLEITQQRNGDETRFRYSIDIPEVAFNRFESPAIIGDLQLWVRKLYHDIEQAWLGSAGNREIFNDNLKARGAALFKELVPPPLADLLWRLYREGKLKSVLVRSDEPFVPWEIARLDDPAIPESPDGCFLGELGLCRWLYGAVPPPRIRVRPGRMQYVVPHYPEPRFRLRAAEQVEEPMLVALGAKRVEPHYRDVTATLQSGGFDLLHFAGHGVADGSSIDGAAVLLEGSYAQAGGAQRYVTEPLAAPVVARKAKLRGPDNNRPLVVLNACQVGRLGFNLTSLGGFAPAFLGARVGESNSVGEAGAFVSCLWSVGDEPASHFARALYQALQVQGGTTMGRAVTIARAAARSAGDATWLSYAVYAHPNCLLEFTP